MRLLENGEIGPAVITSEPLTTGSHRSYASTAAMP